MKKVQFTARPPAAAASTTADAWVADKPSAPEPVKRLTIDIPLNLHRRVKAGCVRDEVFIADVVRDFLEGRFPAERPTRPHDDTTARKGDGS